MMDYLYFIKAEAGAGTALARTFLDDIGPDIAAQAQCLALRLNLAIEPPQMGALYANEAKSGEDWDLSLELSCESHADFTLLRALFEPRLRAYGAEFIGYRVQVRVEKDELPQADTQPNVGYKLMRGIFAQPDLSTQAFRRSWDRHVWLAKKIHGFARYTRFLVEEAVTPDAPAIAGATGLHFASAEDLRERYFQGPDGRVLITHDIGHFIESGLSRLFSAEYILK